MNSQRHPPLPLTSTEQAREALLRRFPSGGTVCYGQEKRTGTVLGSDTTGRRLLLRRHDIRDGEWEQIAVAVTEVKRGAADAA